MNLETVKAQLVALHNEHIAPTEQIASDLAKRIDQLQASIIAEARDYALSTGDFKFSEHIEIKRKPVTYLYDAVEVLEAAKREGATELIRIKEELNKVELNKGLKDGKYTWIQAEPVQDITVSIRPLGDLLILLGKK